MKTMYGISLIVAVMVVSSGCNKVVGDLKDAGVTEKNTELLVFYGSEAAGLAPMEVTVRDKQIIKDVWKSIKSSTQSNDWKDNQKNEIRFYVKGQSKPSAVLIVNSDDAAYVRGSRRYKFDQTLGTVVDMHRCKKLFSLTCKTIEIGRNAPPALPTPALPMENEDKDD